MESGGAGDCSFLFEIDVSYGGGTSYNIVYSVAKM